MPYEINRLLTVEEKNNLSHFSDILAHLLFHRGLTTNHEANDFINPDYDLHSFDPFLLKDAEKSADRIIQAIKNNQKIAIYSDYDADGIPGATILSDFFNRINYKNYIVYIPHRHNEGFGLNVEAVNNICDQGVQLIITIDCGISDVSPVDVANTRGVEVIITDHHESPTILPKAFAIVDHKQKDCYYPDKNLCGSGVIFKLIQAILKKERFGLKDGHEKWLLDLVGLATLSDMVSLRGENRVLAHFGLKVLRKSPRIGIRKLLQKLNINQANITEDDIGFMITPRINAASRMGVPMDAYKLLSAETESDADIYVEHLDHINNERKGIVASLVKEVKKTLNDRYSINVPSVIVLGNPSWRPALLGLVANSCAEEFNRPVFLWGRDGDNAIKGSCRSTGVHVVELMKAVPNGILTQFGGHHFSGGFGVMSDKVHYLDQHLNEAFSRIGSLYSEKEELGNIQIDKELLLNDIDWQLEKEISKLAPFGIDNPKPVFLFRNIAPQNVRLFGKGHQKEHIELTFNVKNRKISAISFFGANDDWAKHLQANQNIDMIASIEKSFFRGRNELRLRIIDIKLI
jgi:single-stranded-DNA-specific exonuclease